MPPPSEYDCIILGGGPAGLAAAVYLGRYLRPTLLLDEKTPRTRWHRPIANNVLGYPAGIHRTQLLDWGRVHVSKYECVHLRRASVVSVRIDGDIHGQQGGSGGLFLLTDTDGQTYRSRGLILCPGVEYELPDIPGLLPYAGKAIWHCPECDGHKTIGKKIAVIGNGLGSAEMALNLTVWCDDVTLCTHGLPDDLDDDARHKLAAANIPVKTSQINALKGHADDGLLEGFHLADGGFIPAAGAFANLGCRVPIELYAQLPLELARGRWIKTDHRMRTNIPRCYAAGDVVADAQTQLSVAMGTGATAAIWLHKELLPPHLCISNRGW